MSISSPLSQFPSVRDVSDDKSIVLQHPRRSEAITTALERIRSIDLDFYGKQTGYLTHSLHPYPAKFIPQLPNVLIREFSLPGDTVADVFCGSGTTLVEALLLGRNAIGVDANPLACLISAAKTTKLNLRGYELLIELAERAEALACEVAATSEPTLWRRHPFKSNAPRPNSEAISFWFESFVVEELAEILFWCRAVEAEGARTVALVAFSSILVSVSKQDSDTRYVRRNKQLRPGDTAQRFARSLRASASAAQAFGDRVLPGLNREIHYANVLDAPELPDFDLMVCSPPYPNAFSYHLYHMTRMLWLGLDQPRFKIEEIGSHRKYSKKGANAATAETFRTEMNAVLHWMSGRLKRDGIACFVIGDSTIRGERISNADLIADAAAAIGYEELLRKGRQLQATKKAFNPAIGRIKQETVLILKNGR